MIMTIGQRLRAFERTGIETTFVLPFSLEFARLTPAEFAEQVLAQALRARCVLVGDDFRFGFKQSGSVKTLIDLGEQLGFSVEPVAPVLGDGERVSSTAIRQLISKGRVSKACRMMAAPFALEGAIVRGFGIGSKQTVPTLNLAPENELLPGKGVYATRARDETSGRKWNSITNVGYRPTFEGKELTVETFLLEPPPASAPERIEVQFLSHIREERRFETPEALKLQILRDAGAATRFHRRLARLNVG
jgi:riboflavin kinase/FMN adenylyltransferase